MWEALLLGIIQGVTEFMPISSSAHLTLLPQMLGWKSPLLNSLAFGVALHLGTLIALLVFFYHDIISVTRAFFQSSLRLKFFRDAESRLAWLVILGTLPAVVAGLTLGEKFETTFRQPGWVAIWLVGFGVCMALAERWTNKVKDFSRINFLDALLIGLAQALALFPGVSRSGSTMTAGLLLGFRRETAARFSFWLSMPVILGALVVEARKLVHYSAGEAWVPLVIGTAAAALAGYVCIRFLLTYLQVRTLYIFVIYRIIFGSLIFWWVAFP